MNSNIKKKLKSEGFRKKAINSLAQQTICLRTLNKQTLMRKSLCYKFSHHCCPSQGVFPPPTVQTLVPFSGNNWPVGWSCCPTSLCYLLDVLSSGTLEPLSIRISRSLHHGVCIVFSVFDDDDGYKRGQTSRPIVGAEVQTNCNFEAHIYHCSYHLDFGYCLFFMRFTWWPYNSFAPSHNYTTLPGYFTCIIHKDFSHSQISSGSGRRSRSTTAEPIKFTEHSSIQKSSVWCTVGEVSISCLFCTILYRGNRDCTQ